MLHVVFHTPQIPPNTGNAIRLAAVTGAALHLVEPLGFDLSDSKLKRAGLDYHDLATTTVHPSLDAVLTQLRGRRVLAFTARADRSYADISYREDDVLLFGPEDKGLPPHVLEDPRVDELVRIPMLAGRRSLNLSNAAAIAVYEAWRQRGFVHPPEVPGT